MTSDGTVLPIALLSVCTAHVQCPPPFLALRATSLANWARFPGPCRTSHQIHYSPASSEGKWNEVALSLKVTPWWQTSSFLRDHRGYSFIFKTLLSFLKQDYMNIAKNHAIERFLNCPLPFSCPSSTFHSNINSQLFYLSPLVFTSPL